MNITLHIPIKPYALKYLKVHLGDDYKISKNDAFGIYLENILRRPQEDARYCHFMKKYTGDFEVFLSKKNWLSDGFRLSPKGIVDFNSFVENIIKAELHSFIDFSRSLKIRQAKAVELFREKYNITEEDIAFDSFKKSYRRYRIKEEEKSQKKRLVPA